MSFQVPSAEIVWQTTCRQISLQYRGGDVCRFGGDRGLSNIRLHIGHWGRCWPLSWIKPDRLVEIGVKIYISSHRRHFVGGEFSQVFAGRNDENRL